MRFLSVCSGIEAASVAWQPLGWKAVAFSEIEPFPSAVLAHHYPDTPNWGDMTKFKDWPDATVDLLCGGTPCQSFSVAGLRKGLDDPRGNLMLTFGAIAARYRPRWLVWENVPGVLSSNGGRDFGTFLGLLGHLGYGFAYRVLDAQYFGVAQRRRRVFVVGCAGDWRAAAAVLFESHSLSGHPAPRREAGKVAPTIPARSTGGGGLGTDFDCDGGLIPSPHTDVSPALKARDSKGPSSDGDGDGDGAILVPMVAHTLRGAGFDASEDGTGRGTPLVPVGVTIHGTDPTVQKVASIDPLAQCLRARTPGNIDNSSTTVVMQPIAYAIQAGAIKTNPNIGPDGVGVRADDCAYTLEARAEVQAVAFDTTQVSSAANYSNPKPGDPCHPLAAGAHAPAIAFSSKDHGADATADLSPTLRAMPHDGSHANGGGQMAVAVALRGREGGATAELGDEVQNCLRASSGGGDKPHVLTAMQVRRLTPVECERLQGFPDGYTAIPWRGKPADQCPDGPRYKALGNSWAVPCAAWIGRRIALVEAINTEQEAA